MQKAIEFLKKNENNFYFVFRVLVGLLFVQHGAQKLFGVLGGNQVATYFSLFGAAGIIEFFGGLMIAFGLFTRLVAFLGACVMIGAWVKVHIPRGLIPLENGGEVAALFFAAFLIILVMGGKKWALDNYFKKN